MTGSTTAVIVMPIVIAISLVIWLSAVFWANRHPYAPRHTEQISTEVRGGAFQAIEGGRQLMPIPEHRPAVPGQRQAAAETYRVPAGSATASDAGRPEPGGPDDQAETRPMAGRPPA